MKITTIDREINGRRMRFVCCENCGDGEDAIETLDIRAYWWGPLDYLAWYLRRLRKHLRGA